MGTSHKTNTAQPGLHHRLTPGTQTESRIVHLVTKGAVLLPQIHHVTSQGSVTEMDTAALPPAQEMLHDFVWSMCYKFRKILAQKTSIIH